MKLKDKKDWGGARQGSGAKPKYSEKTTTIAFRVPISKVDEVKEIIKNKQTIWKKLIQD
jgi:hypothetical protein